MADTSFEKGVLQWLLTAPLRGGPNEDLLSSEETDYLTELVERDIELKDF
jgi:hypothetical protein